MYFLPSDSPQVTQNTTNSRDEEWKDFLKQDSLLNLFLIICGLATISDDLDLCQINAVALFGGLWSSFQLRSLTSISSEMYLSQRHRSQTLWSAEWASVSCLYNISRTAALCIISKNMFHYNVFTMNVWKKFCGVMWIYTEELMTASATTVQC